MNNRGVALFIILGILVVMMIMAFMVSQMSVNERRATKTSLEDVKIHNLLLSGLKLAMRDCVTNGNDYDDYMNFSGERKNHLYYVMRKPLKKAIPEMKSGIDKLGFDKVLATSDPNVPIKEFSAAEINLQPLIDEMGGKIVDFKIAVKYSSTSGVADVFSLEPKDVTHKTLDVTAKRFVNPSLDVLWSNGEIPAITLTFPPFAIKITVNVGYAGITFPFNLTPLLTASGILDAFGIGTGNKLDMNALLNPIFSFLGFQLPHTIPIKVASGTPPFPTADNQYPLGSIPVDYESDFANNHIEKYGKLFMEAEIKYRSETGKIYKATASGKLPFHVSDIQPVASMYSFFVNNKLDRKICFNGGFKDPYDTSRTQAIIEPEDEAIAVGKQNFPQFYVNNMSFNFLKSIATNQFNTGTDPAIYNKNLELPGLIRVNGTKEHIVNIPWFGGKSDSGTMNPFRNTGIPLVMRQRSNRFSVTNGDLSASLGSLNSLFPNPSYAVMPLTTWLVNFVGKSVTAFAADIVTKGWKQAMINALEVGIRPKCHWDWPWGIKGLFLLTEKFDYYVAAVPRVSKDLPIIPYTASPTHLFGEYAILPTMSREIEGNVKKRWIHWSGQIIYNDIPPIPPIPAMYFQNTEERDWYEYSVIGMCPPYEGITSEDNPSTSYNEHVEFKPTEVDKQVPGLFDFYQYVKKAGHYYKNYAEFAIDAKKRIDPKDGYYVLEGVVFVKCLPKNDPDYCPLYLGGFKVSTDINGNFTKFEPSDVDIKATTLSTTPDYQCRSPLKIKGRGMIVTNGDIVILDSVLQKRDEGNPKTTFATTLSLLAISPDPASSAQNWPVIRMGKGQNKWGASIHRIEASVYAQGGVITDGNVIIHGNLVCDNFSTALLRAKTDDEFLKVQFDSRETKTSLASIHPTKGKYDFRRYYVTIGEWLEDFQYGRK